MHYVKWGVLGAATVLVADIAAGTAFINGLSPGTAKIAKYAVGGAFVAVAHKWLVPGG